MKRYYVVSLKSGEEDTAIDNLKRQGFIVYRPMLHTIKTIRGKAQQTIVPMFDGYMFVKFDIDKDMWRCISGTKGVYELLTATEDKCSPVPVGFVESLRKQQVDGAIHFKFANETLAVFRLPSDKSCEGMPRQLITSFEALKSLMVSPIN